MISPILTLREETDQDLAFLVAVYGATRGEELALTPWTVEQKDAFIRMQFSAQRTYYRAHFSDASFDLILADGEPAGRLYVYRGTKEIHIIDIALLPGFRRKGFGTALVSDLLAEGRASGRRVTIHVERNNPALVWYQRLGFRVVREENPIYLFLEYPAAPSD